MTATRRTIGAGLAVTFALAVAGTAPAGQSDVQKARRGTARFQTLAHATQAGYAKLKDKDGVACIDNPGVGGMGVHYVNGDLVGKNRPILSKPDVLVYDPAPNGHMRLVALEYVVFQKAWDEHHHRPPRLFGRTFELVPEGNRYGLDPFYELHAWVWKKNPRGMFDDWNPRVSC